MQMLRFAQHDSQFFHTFEAFPHIRRQSRFGILTFRDFDASLPLLGI